MKEGREKEKEQVEMEIGSEGVKEVRKEGEMQYEWTNGKVERKGGCKDTGTGKIFIDV